MIIEENTLHDINAIAEWLSGNRSKETVAINADLIVLAGHAVVPAILGVLTLAAETNLPLLFSGGVGHSTELLRDALAVNPLTCRTTFNQPGEAEILYSLATDFFAIPPTRLYVENRSSNCGENAAFTRDMILAQRIPADRIVLCQDPLMQRRTRETFEFCWQQKAMTACFTDWSVFVPELLLIGDSVTITGAQSAGIWSLDRFIAMLLGELRRLNDDSQGYGPAGSGFIGHVDFPPHITAAWQRIMQCEQLSGLSRA